MTCGVGHRLGTDPTLLWLWCRLAATAPMRLQAWEPPYAVGSALRQKDKKKKKKKKKTRKALIHADGQCGLPITGGKALLVTIAIF